MKRNIMIVLAAVFAAIFLFSGMMLWQDYRDQKASAEVFDNVADLIMEETQPATEPYAEDAGTFPMESEEITEPVAEMTAYEKYSAVYAQNNDFVGWLCIEGTNINYPVMETVEEPNYYLKRGFDRAYSDYGVPYVQENCALGISDNIVIYGHNMSNGSMFADLCKYEDESFFQDHPIIRFDTLSGYGEYEIVAVFKTVAYADLGDQFGSEQRGYRPVVIVQNDVGNLHSPTVIVASITSKTDARAKLPTHHYLGASCGLERSSVILTEQLDTLDKRRLQKHVGFLDNRHLWGMNHALAVSVGLIEPKPRAMSVCLCSACANNFYGTGDYYLKRINPYEVEKGMCTYCNQRLGFDYMVVERRRGR